MSRLASSGSAIVGSYSSPMLGESLKMYAPRANIRAPDPPTPIPAPTTEVFNELMKDIEDFDQELREEEERLNKFKHGGVKQMRSVVENVNFVKSCQKAKRNRHKPVEASNSTRGLKGYGNLGDLDPFKRSLRIINRMQAADKAEEILNKVISTWNNNTTVIGRMTHS